MIHKSILTLLCACAITICAHGALPQFKTNFSGGIPPEVILIDGDGNTPATAMEAIGFSVGTPWIGYYIEDEDQHVACSTSWYKPAGTSDDWMILPAISVEPGAVLKWRARSSDKKYFDGYAVYASTEGSDREAFDTAAPLFATEAESNEWTSYQLDLSPFAGQELNIAFVNNSTNKARLYIDDVFAGTKIPLLVTLDIPALVKDKPEGNDVTVSGIVSSELDDPSTLGDITLSYGSETITITPQQIASGECAFTFAQPVHIAPQGIQSINVAASSASGHNHDASVVIRSTTRPGLAEEFTGTWCSWCIRGIVYMEAIKEAYGELVIPLCVHEDDVMETPEYFRGVDYLTEPSIPNAIVNRKYECDPAQLDQYCSAVQANDDIAAAITSVQVDYASATGHADITVNTTFAHTVYDGAYRLAYVLVEDNVYVPDDMHYCQKNAYSGGAAGPMGGYEDMPSVIMAEDMVYHDVVRYVSEDGPHGVHFSLPGQVVAGEEYTHTYAIDLPETIINPKELALVIIILDDKTGEALNAHRLMLKDYDSTPDSVVTLPTDDSTPIYYDLRGFRIDRPTAPGLYIHFSNGKARKTIIK